MMIRENVSNFIIFQCQGPLGKSGLPGFIGPPGLKGDTGLPGAKGDNGLQGLISNQYLHKFTHSCDLITNVFFYELFFKKVCKVKLDQEVKLEKMELMERMVKKEIKVIKVNFAYFITSIATQNTYFYCESIRIINITKHMLIKNILSHNK